MKKTVSAAFVALAVMPGGAHAEAHVCAGGIKAFARYRVAAAICDPQWTHRGAYEKVANESNGCTLRAAQIGKGLSTPEWEALEGESINEVIRQVLTAGRSDAFCAAMDAEMNGAERR
jgi:hypothetical protein